MSNDIPRRSRLDLMSPAERAIYDAVMAVEAMPADVRLTDAVILLQSARIRVADFVDGISGATLRSSGGGRSRPGKGRTE